MNNYSGQECVALTWLKCLPRARAIYWRGPTSAARPVAADVEGQMRARTYDAVIAMMFGRRRSGSISRFSDEPGSHSREAVISLSGPAAERGSPAIRPTLWR